MSALGHCRTLLPAIVLLLCSLSGASAREDAASHDGRIYIATGSEHNYAAIEAPIPARQLGVITLTSLSSLRNPKITVPSVLGGPGPSPSSRGEPSRASRAPEESLAPGWPSRPTLALTGNAPFGTTHNGGDCKCRTTLADTGERRIAALYTSQVFTVGDEIGSVRTLRLRARYRDGLIAYINGKEVARRNIAESAGPRDIAIRPHGPEWETFYIPVVPGLLSRGDNILAVETRPSGRRLAPFLDLELTASDRARIIRGPMLQRVSPTSATLVFETDQPVAGLVEYGQGPQLGQTLRSAGGGLATRHVVELTGLPAGKPVHYRVEAGGDLVSERKFHTAPSPGDVVRFAVYGDVRGGHGVHGDIIRSMAKEAPDFVLMTGDLVLRGTDEGDWQKFFAVTGDFLTRTPYYPVAGNHDMGRAGDQRRRMNEIFELWPGPKNRPTWGHWYSFDIAGVHFVMLDSNSYEHHQQLDWLERDLKEARQRGVRAIFATVHAGPYSRGIHQGHQYAAKHYAPILARYGVTLTFSGHDHLYQRGQIDGFAYIVSGGGGAPLYSVRCGGPGQRRCRANDGMQHVASEHHYIMVTVYPRHVEVCPKRVDGTPLEECITYRLPRKWRPKKQHRRTK